MKLNRWPGTVNDLLHVHPPVPQDLREERIALDDRRQDTDANAVVRVRVQREVRGNNLRARLHVVVEEQQNLPRRAPGALVPRRRRSE